MSCLSPLSWSHLLALDGILLAMYLALPPTLISLSQDGESKNSRKEEREKKRRARQAQASSSQGEDEDLHLHLHPWVISRNTLLFSPHEST